MNKEKGWARIQLKIVVPQILIFLIKISNRSQTLRSAPHSISVREKAGMTTWFSYVLEIRKGTNHDLQSIFKI